MIGLIERLSILMRSAKSGANTWATTKMNTIIGIPRISSMYNCEMLRMADLMTDRFP